MKASSRGAWRIGVSTCFDRLRVRSKQTSNVLAGPERLPPRCTLSSAHGARAPREAILTTPPVLLNRALLFEVAEDRADGASRSGALGRLIDMLNQGPEFHGLFAQSGNDCIGCGSVDRRAAMKRVDAGSRADDCTFREQ